MEKYYQILNLKPTASLPEIKQAYRQLARKWHPDRFINEPEKQEKAQEKFKQINQAYKILKAYISNQKTDFFPEVSANKTTAEYFYNLGIQIAKQGNLEESLDYFARAIKLNPEYLEALIYRKKILEKLGFQNRAKADARKILEIELKQRKKSNHNVKYQNQTTYKHRKNKQEYQSVKSSKSSLLYKVSLFFIFIILILILFVIIVSNF